MNIPWPTFPKTSNILQWSSLRKIANNIAKATEIFIQRPGRFSKDVLN